MAAQAPSRQTCQDTFESAVAMSLHLWQPLSFAVESNLGGGDGADKRDWFAGAIAELFEDAWTSAPLSSSTTSTVAEDLLMDTESRLLQIMDDEFDTVVDDGSAYDVASSIVQLWTQCRRGQFAGSEALRQKFEASQGKSVRGAFHAGKAPDADTAWQTDDEDDDDDEDDEGDEDDSRDDDAGGDVNMDEAPALVDGPATRSKPEPEVDEDGFTTVTRKKR
ncbi:pre-rRNA processing protein [Sporothrix brasiliensis 5110]|uniref:Pre-rRNA processing protein n=1 Tax=Sporothrix brasiliensis 5110 TaxID=1398154 RepID=A0A0C2EPM4_9PEZI|nr:pre-rRNA processing protein [Sporothrix brasiliensis 5110]KIH88189.1 pre-rRNA processing protein [Sporothrix brasiliensis 5110]